MCVSVCVSHTHTHTHTPKKKKEREKEMTICKIAVGDNGRFLGRFLFCFVVWEFCQSPTATEHITRSRCILCNPSLCVRQTCEAGTIECSETAYAILFRNWPSCVFFERDVSTRRFVGRCLNFLCIICIHTAQVRHSLGE